MRVVCTIAMMVSDVNAVKNCVDACLYNGAMLPQPLPMPMPGETPIELTFQETGKTSEKFSYYYVSNFDQIADYALSVDASPQCPANYVDQLYNTMNMTDLTKKAVVLDASDSLSFNLRFDDFKSRDDQLLTYEHKDSSTDVMHGFSY